MRRKEQTMTMIRVSPLQVQVRTNWFDGRPRAVRIASEDLPVLAVTRIRQEAAAYRSDVGPRTCFEVTTRAARLELVFRHRDRRWLVEGLEAAEPGIGAGPEPLARAA